MFLWALRLGPAKTGARRIDAATAAPVSDDLQTLAKGGRTSVFGFFVRLIARIPFLIVAGQWYGATQMGRLAFAVAVVEFAAQITTLGLKRGLALHMTGDGKENGAWDAVLVVLGATLIPTVGLMLFPQAMFPNSPIKPLDYLLPLAIPAIALSDVMLAALAYRLNIAATVRARSVIEPWVISIAAVALWQVAPNDGLLIAYSMSMGAALIASIVPFLASFGLPRNWHPKPIELFGLARRNAPLVAADAIEWGSRRLDVLILGLFVSPATVGIYWIAQQIASLPQKLKTSFDPVLGPVITKKLADGDKAAVAAQISQVGFWILAAQTGVALALGIPGEGLMELLGPARDYVSGTGALALLLLAEVVAALAVVSEAALVYIARHRNMLISLGMIGLQALVSVVLVITLRTNGFDEAWQSAGVALALVISLAFGSIVKSLTAQRLLGAPVKAWRWPILTASAAAIVAGQLFIQLPQWAELVLGIPAILALYGWIIWTRGFGEEDRLLFRK